MSKTLIGIVTSDKRDKTITVSIASRETHPLYRKQYTKTRKYTAHDEKNDARVGDKVEIVACRPFSKTVAFNLVKIIERSHGTVELKDNVTEAELPEKEKMMTARRSERGASSLASPSEEERTAFDSEGGKR